MTKLLDHPEMWKRLQEDLNCALDELKAAQDEIAALRSKVEYQEGVIRQWEREYGDANASQPEGANEKR